MFEPGSALYLLRHNAVQTGTHIALTLQRNMLLHPQGTHSSTVKVTA
jgi:hypothetical protein